VSQLPLLGQPQRDRVWPYAVYLAIAVWFTWPIYAVPQGLGIMDWDQHFFFYASVLKSVRAFWQLPFWNPWYCGGNVLWQNPQVAVLSPVYPLTLVMTLPMAMKVTITAHFFASFVGMHLLVTRVFRLTFFPVVLFIASLYTLAGAHVLHIGVGHTTFLPFLYLPLALFFTCRAFETGAIRHAVPAGAVMAFGVWNGGIYAAAMGGLSIAGLAAVLSVLERRWRPILVVAVMGASLGLFAAPKIVPVAMALGSPHFQDLREISKGDSITWGEAVHALSNPERPAGFVGWFEYGNYIGVFGSLIVAACLWFVLMKAWRKERALAVSLALVAVALLFLLRGDFGPHAPFTMLRALPVFSTFRSPGRYTIVFALVAAAMVAAAIRLALEGGDVPRGLRQLLGILLLAAVYDQASHNRPILVGVLGQGPLDPKAPVLARAGAPMLDVDNPSTGPDSPMIRSLAENRDLMRCYETLHPDLKAVPSKDIVWSPDPNVKVFSSAFSPNRIEFTVLTGAADARVYLNQNYIEGWRSSAGAVAFDPGVGLGYVTLPRAFAGRVTFSFRPPGLFAGVALFALGLVLSRWLWRRTF